MRKWMPGILVIAALIASLLAWPRLPDLVQVDLSQLTPVDSPADAAPRWLAAFLLPAVAALVWLAFLFGRSRRGERMQNWLFARWAPQEVLKASAFERFGKTYDLVVTLVVAFIVLFHALLLGLGLGGPDWLVRGFSLLVGLGMAALGNVTPRMRPNPIMGVRTSTTLNHPQIWARTHRVMGGCIVASGALMIVCTIVLPRYALLAGIVGLLVSCLIAFAYSTSISAARA